MCKKKKNSSSFKNAPYNLFAYKWCMYKLDLTLNNPQELIWHQIKSQKKQNYSFLNLFIFVLCVLKKIDIIL